tara:strand:+ start:616 stop:1785 length:1170 start_codon:yes stop_codon:yes gene_type:complete
MEKIIDLGMHPYADTFIKKDQLNKTEPIYPLQCFLDKKTGYVKVGLETNPDERYNLYDYSYTSSNSELSKKYWKAYAKEVCKKLKLNKPIKITEIGSNDGYLAKQFQKKKHKVLGVDSSTYMAEIANKLGINTHCGIFDSSLSKDIYNKYGKMDLIVANNVFNHSNDPLDFALGVKNLLTPEGVFVFEVPYWYNTITDKKFDQIYHEHVSYFTVKSSNELLKKIGLTVFDAEVVDYHGGSIRIYSKVSPTTISPNVNKLIDKEQKEGLFEIETYSKFMSEIKLKRAKFLKKLYKIKEKNIPVIAVGAAAKGNTFLNFYNLDSTIIDYVTDVSIHKKDKYTPLTRIPIQDDKTVFEKYKDVYVIILSWNISSMLKKKLKQFNKNIKFLSL